MAILENIARVRNCPDITILNSLPNLCLFLFLSFCLFIFMSFCHFDQMSKGSQVPKVTLCVQILKWQLKILKYENSVIWGRGVGGVCGINPFHVQLLGHLTIWYWRGWDVYRKTIQIVQSAAALRFATDAKYQISNLPMARRELEFDFNNSEDCCLSSTQIPPIPNGAYLSASYTILEILETDLQKLNWLPIFDVKLFFQFICQFIGIN